MPGLYFDELSVARSSRSYRARSPKPINVWFSCLTHNPAYLHLDEQYCQEHTEFGHRIVNSALSGSDGGNFGQRNTHGTAIANLGWDEVRFPTPLFHGDTIHVETEFWNCAKANRGRMPVS